MSMTFYNAALVAHVAGITLMAGTTFIDFITFRAFCKTYMTDVARGLELEGLLQRLQQFLGIGMLLILLSGVLMMVKLHAAWGAQLWFQIKMGVLVLIIINGLGIRRVLGGRLKKRIADNTLLPDQKWDRFKSTFLTVAVVQLLLFLFIYTLSIFKFN